MYAREGKWLGKRSGLGGGMVGEEWRLRERSVGKEEWLERRCSWEGGVVGEEEWLGRKSGWEGGVVGEEEWLGRKSGRGREVIREEERLGMTSG